MEESAVEEKCTIKSSYSKSTESVKLGRVINTLLSSRPKKLLDSISRFASNSNAASVASLDESLWFLHEYVRDATQKQEYLDQVLIPMIENSMKSRGSKHSNQTMILLNWMFEDKLLFEVLATNLANIILRKEDHYTAFGWCLLVRGLLEYGNNVDTCLTNGIRGNYNALLKIFSSCIPQLSIIMGDRRTLQDGYELPTRFSAAAADCVLVLTTAFTKKTPVTKSSSNGHESLLSSENPSKRWGSSNSSALVGEKKVKPTSKSPEVSNPEMDLLLWCHLDELVVLVQRLLAWNRKSRPLHVKGVEQVLKWLQEIKKHYGCFPDEAGSKNLSTGVLLLSSCWKHYGVLLHLEDHTPFQHYKELLEQYLQGIQFYTDNFHEEDTENKDSGIETRKFFLNCVSLLLGRFDGKQFENIMLEYGPEIPPVLLQQLRCADDDIIDGAICIFKAVIFKAKYSSLESDLTDTKLMDAVLPSLLHLLDERDSTARAVVMLIAEYCLINTDGHCLQEILKRLDSGSILQRRNAVDVISELIRSSSSPSSSNSVHMLSHSTWQDIGSHLLQRLGDEDSVIRAQSSNLLAMIDPSLTLPALLPLVYSSQEILAVVASDAVVGVLKYHSERVEVISMLLDSLSNLIQRTDLAEASGDKGKGSKLDPDRVLKLIPEWSKSVQDWNILIEPLIEKMFAEPSNAIIVRFLSYLSEHLEEYSDIVLRRILLHMKGQNGIDESFFSRRESVEIQHTLFDRLCPLLIIRLLPLRVFNDLKSYVMYGQLHNQGTLSDSGDINISNHDCIVAILLSRAYHKFEFEDVRKLAAELSGRIHPQVLFPVICSELEHAAESQDTLKIKACLFSVCTSLMVRGRDSSILHPFMLRMRRTLETILLWPSLDGDEVSKAQHGCIDCLALMICAELRESTSDDIDISGRKSYTEDSMSRDSVLNYVIYRLTNDHNERIFGSKSGNEASVLSSRTCMANVLISACQKISDFDKKPFAQITLPRLIGSVEAITNSEIRAACVQVLFSIVYHTKRAILPFPSALLKVSLYSLRQGSDKEKMAGAKLLASLMASEDEIVKSISGGLLEVRSVLSTICSSDPSPDLRRICKQLLLCITSP